MGAESRWEFQFGVIQSSALLVLFLELHSKFLIKLIKFQTNKEKES
jgi:hypothetical protein